MWDGVSDHEVSAGAGGNTIEQSLAQNHADAASARAKSLRSPRRPTARRRQLRDVAIARGDRRDSARALAASPRTCARDCSIVLPPAPALTSWSETPSHPPLLTSKRAAEVRGRGARARGGVAFWRTVVRRTPLPLSELLRRPADAGEFDRIDVDLGLGDRLASRWRAPGRQVMVTGNPGDGKTHLIARLQRHLEAAGALVIADANEYSDEDLLETWRQCERDAVPLVLAINEWPLFALYRHPDGRDFGPLSEALRQVRQSNWHLSEPAAAGGAGAGHRPLAAQPARRSRRVRGDRPALRRPFLRGRSRRRSPLANRECWTAGS